MEAHRDEDDVEASQAQGRGPDDEAEGGAESHRSEHNQGEGDAGLRYEVADVATDAEKCGVGQGKLTGEARQQI